MLFGLVGVASNFADFYFFNYEVHSAFLEEFYQSNTSMTNVTYRSYRLPSRYLYLPTIVGGGFPSDDVIFSAI